MKKIKGALPVISLIIANSIPLFGALFWGWGVFELVLLYWFESAIIGIYNIMRIGVVAKWESLFLIPFFSIHYSAFMVGHLIFLTSIFGGGLYSDSFLAFPSLHKLAWALYPVRSAILALIISHGVSFIVNFLMKREYKRIDAGTQFNAPYKRIMIMHVSIVFAGGFAVSQGGGMPLLLLLVAIKLGTDLHAHYKLHQKRQSSDLAIPAA